MQVAEQHKGLDEEWKSLIQRTFTEGVAQGDVEVVRSKSALGGPKHIPKVLKKSSNIIILHIDY
jgi:hypothetical protein